VLFATIDNGDFTSVKTGDYDEVIVSGLPFVLPMIVMLFLIMTRRISDSLEK